MKNPCYLSASISASLGSDLLPHHPTTTTLEPGTRDAILFQRLKSPMMDLSEGKERDTLHQGQGHRIGVGRVFSFNTPTPFAHPAATKVTSASSPKLTQLLGRKSPVEESHQ